MSENKPIQRDELYEILREINEAGIDKYHENADGEHPYCKGVGSGMADATVSIMHHFGLGPDDDE